MPGEVDDKGNPEERTVPLEVLTAQGKDKDARIADRDEEIQNLNRQIAALKSPTEDGGPAPTPEVEAPGDYKPEDVAFIEGLISKAVGGLDSSRVAPMVEMVKSLLESQHSVGLQTKVSAIKEVPPEFQPEALSAEIAAVKAEAGAAGRFITAEEAYGQIIVGKLPELLEASGKTSEAERVKLLAEKKLTVAVHSGEGVSPEMVGTEGREWYDKLPHEDKEKKEQVTQSVYHKVLTRLGIPIPPA
ncbi:hypothetical protein LCGC14_0394030 [marine sediment metagenome]|uniref:Uncharacterized protein n=1 Tax=marine sediment metagenome TaxID=412755 RepID=A0A0F9W7N5_9ZZZZ